MGVRILTDPANGSCLYCSVSGVAFGFVFRPEDDPEDFLAWLAPVDARALSQDELVKKYYEWRAQNENEK